MAGYPFRPTRSSRGVLNCRALWSFRGARSANPEIQRSLDRDSGFALRAPRNDGLGHHVSTNPVLDPLARNPCARAAAPDRIPSSFSISRDEVRLNSLASKPSVARYSDTGSASADAISFTALSYSVSISAMNRLAALRRRNPSPECGRSGWCDSRARAANSPMRRAACRRVPRTKTAPRRAPNTARAKRGP